MAFTLKVDFDNLYDIEPISEDIRSVVFNTELINDQELPLHVVISHETHELLPNVYNLAFGPIGANGKIDDKIEITHKDYSKVFSTILFVAFTYLTNNPEHYLGIDGSNNGRAYFYYRALQRNYAYLDEQFNMYGIKYYVRITRYGKTQYDNPFDFDDISAVPNRILPGTPIPAEHMYNYFIFNKRN